MANQKASLTPTLLFAVIVASLGTWFPLGYNIVAMNGPQSAIIDWIRGVECSRLNSTSELWCEEVPEERKPMILAGNPYLTTIWAIVSAISGFGGLVSTFACAFLVNRFGPKICLFITGGLITLGTIIFSVSPLAHAYEMLIVGRLFIGFGFGMICAITPIYTSEVAPVALRGTMGTIPIVMSVMGMLIGTLFGLPFILGSGTRWAILVALQLIPVGIMFAALAFCPDSPTYLYFNRQDKVAAKAALIWLRKTQNVEDELADMELELAASKNKENVGLFRLFKKASLRFPLLVCSVVMFATHFSGYGVVTTYSTSIFNGIGLTLVDSVYSSLGLWITYLTVTLASMLFVDRIGRKTLLLISHGAVMVSFILMVIFMALTRQGHAWAMYGSTVTMFLFIVAYSIGLASIPWFLPSELFAQDARGSAMTIVCAVAWAAVLITTFVYSVIQPLAQEYTYIVFIVFPFLTGLFICWNQPETRGKSIAEIQAMLRRRRGSNL